jgi:O-antigen/teichoic acid export membrane protein
VFGTSETTTDRVADDVLSAAEVKSRAASGVALLLGRGLAFRVLGLLGNLVLARLLVPSDFGIVALGLTLVQLGQFLANAGIGAALIARAEAPSRSEVASIVGLQLAVTSAVAVIVGAVSIAVGDEGLVTALMMLALPLAAFRSPAMLILQRQLAFAKSVRVEISEIVTYLVAAVTLAALGLGAWSLAIATVGKTLIGTLVACAISPQGFVAPSLRLSGLRSIFAFGARYQLTGLLYVGHDAALNGGIAAVSGIAALGLWSFAARILMVPYMLFEAMWGVGFPAFSRLVDAGEEESVRDLLERTVTTVAVSVAAVMCPLVACSPALVPLLFGHAWTDVSLILPGSALGLVTYGPIGICAYAYLYATGDSSTALLGTVLGGSVRLIATFGLLPVVGVAAIGIGWAAASLSELPYVLGRVRRRTPARLGRTVIWPTASAVVGGSAGWEVAQSLGTTAVSGALSAVTATLLFLGLMGVLGRRDLVVAFGMLRRAATLARRGTRIA